MTKARTANPKRLEGAIERIPLKRLGTPADMAGAALFLASPLSSYILGPTLLGAGGLVLWGDVRPIPAREISSRPPPAPALSRRPRRATPRSPRPELAR